MRASKKTGEISEAEKPLDTVAEYQRRRKLQTKYGRPFLAATIFCGLGLLALFYFNIFSPILRGQLFFLLGIGLFASWAIFLFVQTKYGRCPNCERLPLDSRGGLSFNPEFCTKCGARLREYSSLL